jgi:Domain of unknown function (DUF4251)
MASLYFRHILLPILVLISMHSEGQSGTSSGKKDQSAELKNLIDSRKYIFHANSATSMKGMTRHLTGEYFLKVNKDSLQADLPYYGRSFTTSYPPTDLSVQFTTTQFSYVADSAKKGGWSITIVPKNENSASKIYMSVTSTGYCTVQVNSNSRQPISYYGTISAYDAH